MCVCVKEREREREADVRNQNRLYPSYGNAHRSTCKKNGCQFSDEKTERFQIVIF